MVFIHLCFITYRANYEKETHPITSISKKQEERGKEKTKEKRKREKKFQYCQLSAG